MAVDEDKFPIGLRVLVVDDNLACLRILERFLIKCSYRVTITTEAAMALKMLRENQDKFDIVISDVHMPGMDGFKLLELVGLELDLPVIMLSANDDPKLVMKGVRHGAVDYLLKPVRIEELKNIWQHVIRKKQVRPKKGKVVSDSEVEEDGSIPASMDGDRNPNQEDTKTRKRKEQKSTENDVDEDEDEDEEDGCGNEDADSNTHKRPRIVWLPELHKKFVAAVDQLGPEKAFPKKILDLMDVEGLTRENVASHLQKYRLYLKRISLNQLTTATTNPFGAQDSSLYLNGGSLMNPYGVYRSLGGGVGKFSTGSTSTMYQAGTGGMLGQINATAGYRSGLSQPASNLDRCLLPNQNAGIPRLMEIDQFQHQNSSRANNGLPSNMYVQSIEGFSNQASLTAPSSLDVKPHASVPSLQDYTRCMENWQSSAAARSAAQQNLLSRNQLPSSSFNGGFSSDDMSHFQNALLERSSADAFAALGGPNEDVRGGQYSFNAQNVNYNNMVEPQIWQENKIESANISSAYNDNSLVLNIDSSNQSFVQNSSLQYNSFVDSPAAQISAGGTSSFMQNTDVQDSDADALMRLDDSYLLEENELLAGFTQNNCETLEDLVGGLLNEDDRYKEDNR